MSETYNVGVNPAHLAITPNGKFAYVANANNYSIPGSDTVTVLNLKKHVPLLTISDPSFVEPYRIAIDDWGKYAYVCNSGSPAEVILQGTVSIIDISLNRVVGVITGFDGPGAIVLSDKFAYVTNYGAPGGLKSGNGRTVSVVDLARRQIIATIPVDQAPASLALSPKNDYLYVICYVDGKPGTGTLQKIDTRTNQVVKTVSGFFGPFGIAVTDDGAYAYITNFGSNDFAPYGTTVSVVDLYSMMIIKVVETGIQPSGIALLENFAYVSNYNTLYAKPNFQNLTPGEGTVVRINLSTDEVVGPAIPVGQSPSTITLSPDGKKLYVCKYVQNTVVGISLDCP